MVRSSQPDLKSLSCDQGFLEASSWSHNLLGTAPPAPSLCPPGRQLPSTTHMQGRAPRGGSGCVCTEGPGLRLPAPLHPRALCVSKLQTTVQAPGASGLRLEDVQPAWGFGKSSIDSCWSQHGLRPRLRGLGAGVILWPGPPCGPERASGRGLARQCQGPHSLSRVCGLPGDERQNTGFLELLIFTALEFIHIYQICTHH